MASRQSAVSNLDNGKPVYPSGPSTGCGPTPLTTDGRKPSVCLPDSSADSFPTSQSKTGREFEGRALISAAGAVPLTSLDKERLIATALKNRTDIFLSNTRELADLERHSNNVRSSWHKRCGCWTLQGSAPSGGVRCQRLYCKTWTCSRCGPKRAKRTRYAIAAHAEARHLNKFLTLTLDPKRLRGEQATKYLKKCQHKFMTICRRQYGRQLSYICVLEYHKNGNPHLHIILDRYIDKAWIQEKWHAVGGGWVFIEFVHIRKIANYLSPYLSKEMLTSPAPKGTRRVTTSRNIKLFPKIISDLVWTLRKKCIEQVRAEFACEAETEFDESGLLAVFIVSPDQLDVDRALRACYVT
jgi:hypothetical protein